MYRRARAQAATVGAVLVAAGACTSQVRTFATSSGSVGGVGTSSSTSSSGDPSGATGGSGGACAVKCPPVSGLLAYYPLDSDTRDHSGNGNDAVGEDLAPALGKICGAYGFNGHTSTLKACGGAMLAGARTLCAWLCWDDPGTASELGQPIFSAGISGVGPSDTGGDFFSISPSSPISSLPPPGAPFLDHWGTSGSSGTEISVPPGTWHFVCYVYDGAGDLTFYSDGKSATASGAEYQYPLDTLFMGSQTLGGTSIGLLNRTGSLRANGSPERPREGADLEEVCEDHPCPHRASPRRRRSAAGACRA
jgi:hypothetical protein